MQVALEKIVVKPGQQLLLQDISWQDFEEILEELGEHRSSRISYSNGVLENGFEKISNILSYLPRLKNEQVLLDAIASEFWVNNS